MTTVLLTAILVWMVLGLLFWVGFVLFRLRFECAGEPGTTSAPDAAPSASTLLSERVVGTR